jgi:glutamate synthase (NADPH/NADH) small chain
MVACPTSIDIPGFIQRISSGDRQGSADRIFEANVLGASCARVCATEELCEEACVLHAHERPIQIGRLQRYATDLVVDSGGSLPYVAGPDTGKSVAVIGGGPAGLACAAGLRVHGHAVTIFERQPQLGGLATYGIIPLREPTEIALWEADQILKLGATARTGVTVGGDDADVSAASLLDEFDAVFLSSGSGRYVQDIGLDGSDAPGVQDALVFIEAIRTTSPVQVPVGDNVVVVGAGNTAMDACTIAARLQADSVTCVYRRTADEMTGYPDEYEHCKKDGVIFRWLTQPIRVVVDESGHVAGLECERMRLGTAGEDGRPRPEATGELFTIPADHVLLATGQKREPGLFTAFGVDLTSDGQRPQTAAGKFVTSNPQVFAGGDAALTGKELSVVDAVAQGRDAADEMHLALMQGN